MGKGLDNATEQAIDWFVRLDSGDASTSDRLAFDAWLAQSTLHSQAWAALQQRLSGSVETAFAQLRQHGSHNSALGVQALVAPVPKTARRRQMLRGGLATLLVGTVTGWLVNRHIPLATLSADLRTSTAERSRHLLPDGSEITLDARSAVDIAYNASQRLLHLRQGALMVHVVNRANADGAERLPFIVQSAQGTVQALGTRFMVRQMDDDRTLVHVTEHSVRLTTQNGQQHVLKEGHSAWMEANNITPIDAASMSPDAWVEGMIDVRNQSLGEVIDALRPYQPGTIRISKQAARLRIFGVFPLTQPQQVLQDLVDTHPISVRQWGQWLTVIDLADNASL